MKSGDLVSVTVWDGTEILGVVLEVEKMEGIYKDSSGIEPMCSVTVLWEREVPSWLGNGRVCKVSDSVLRVVQ